MIVLGIILLIVGYILPLPLLWTIGWILVLIGVILFVLGHFGGPDRRIAGRRYWY